VAVWAVCIDPVKSNSSASSSARTTSDSSPAADRTTPGKKRILLVDDHPVTRHGLKTLIDQQLGLVVCGEGESAAQALQLFEELQPDLAVVDIALRSSNGIELTKQLKAMSASFPVLIVSMHDEVLYAERAIRAGAMGYVMKQDAGEKVIAAISRLLQGDIFVADPIKERMLQRFTSQRSEAPRFSIDTLSEREMEVFKLIGNGYGTRHIAEQLKLSPKTVDSYREHLKLKLNLSSGAELLRHAIEWGRTEAGCVAS
jgi:DNA-binding NarL/FixJ family response regulator